MSLTIPKVLESQATTARTQAHAMCWKITQREAANVFRFTDWPHSLELREADAPTLQTYAPSYGIESTAGRREDDLQTIEKEARGIISSSAISTADLRAGLYNGAQVDEFLVDARCAFLGYIYHVKYFILQVQYTRGVWIASIGGLASILDRPVGEVWSRSCRAKLFDSLCGLTANSFRRSVTVTSVADDYLEFTVSYTPVGSPDPWDTAGEGNDGTIEWITGDNAGLTFDIKEHSRPGASGTGVFVLHLPAAYEVDVGDTAWVYPGCDKRSGVHDMPNPTGRCRNRFSNITNFQGEPHIPGRDRALKGI